MKAADIMTPAVFTVSPDDSVRHAAELMVRHGVSALPVVASDGKLVGMVSEGDLLHRQETRTEKRRSWWLDVVTGYESRARDYVKAFGSRVFDVMTPNPVTVDESTTVAEIAQLLEGKRIKRVPVLRGATIVGIVSRANLVQAVASAPRTIVPESRPDDAQLRDRVLAELVKHDWARASPINVIAHNGVVSLWGTVSSSGERRALHVAIERIPGVRSVEDRLVFYIPTPGHV